MSVIDRYSKLLPVIAPAPLRSNTPASLSTTPVPSRSTTPVPPHPTLTLTAPLNVPQSLFLPDSDDEILDNDNSFGNVAPRTGTRRRRQDYGEWFYEPPSERDVKRLRTHAAELCTARELPADSLDVYCAFPPSIMLLEIRATQLRNRKKEMLAEMIAEVKSKAFAMATTRRAMAIILSPNLTYFVTGTLRHFFALSKVQQQAFKIPTGLFTEEEATQLYRELLGNKLTSCRSSLRQRVRYLLFLFTDTPPGEFNVRITFGGRTFYKH